jgi:hypothetical protein
LEAGLEGSQHSGALWSRLKQLTVLALVTMYFNIHNGLSGRQHVRVSQSFLHNNVGTWQCSGLNGSASPVKRKRKKTDAYVHIGTNEEYAGGMSDKDRRELECEKVRALQISR